MKLTTLSQEQADYIGVPVEGPFAGPLPLLIVRVASGRHYRGSDPFRRKGR